MWRADVATGPHDEARENDDLLYGLEAAFGNDEEVVEERWHHIVKGNMQDLSESGCNESSPAERRTYPGYSRFETRGFDKPDWRDVTIVSACDNNLYIYNVIPFLFDSFTQALCQLTASLCAFNSYCSTVIHFLLQSLLITFCFSTNLRCLATHVLKQPQLLHS